jgi:hypothetical protein
MERFNDKKTVGGVNEVKGKQIRERRAEIK